MIAVPALCRWLWILPILTIGHSCALVASEQEPPEPAFVLTPTWQRCDIEPGATVELTAEIAAKQQLTVHAATSDCSCMSLLTTLPLTIPAGTTAQLRLRVVGVAAGVKTLLIRTTAGPMPLTIQVATGGLGSGKDLLEKIAAKAHVDHLDPIVIIHDLRGAVRNCGCSTGALGGIDHLAALPAAARALAPDRTWRFVLTGDIDASVVGVGIALGSWGWERNPADIPFSLNPAELIAHPGVMAIISTAPKPPSNRKVIRPLLDGGTVAAVLLMNERGAVTERQDLPIDQTLPSDDKILRFFPDQLRTQVDLTANPSTNCQTCHVSAHAAWAASAHARAWSSLAESDRTDRCISCHSTLITSNAPGADMRAPGVHCQSCHSGSDSHAQSKGKTATHRLVDCRSCHDSRHDPKVRPEIIWNFIKHGK
jgi:hypothetical protein